MSAGENANSRNKVPKLNLNNSGAGNSPAICLGIDFTFNSIKNVQKVTWKNEPVWYREIKEGFSWFCYCMNTRCQVYKQLVVLSRGYTIISLKKDLMTAVCPVCREGNKKTPSSGLLLFKNCGFVNC